MTDLIPREIVSELDRFIIGQAEAKRAVAVALRNRWRCRQLEGDLRDEIYPKNILMIGPTGVGKTEISRRLARLAGARQGARTGRAPLLDQQRSRQHLLAEPVPRSGERLRPGPLPTSFRRDASRRHGGLGP